MYKMTPVGICLILSLVGLAPLSAQTLSQQVQRVFTSVTDLELNGAGEHGDHFKSSNVATSLTTINAFSNSISTNISSFPLSSTVAGITFDFSSGVPVATSTSLGPIFTERAQTLGKGRINLGFNFSHLNLTNFRGLDTDNIRFSFTHQDVGNPGYGDSDNEFDTIDLFLDMEVKASILALVGTVGLTDHLDVGVAIPFTQVAIKANPRAVMNSFTLARNDTANHFFGGTAESPELALTPQNIDDEATGISDIAVRVKYNFTPESQFNMAGMVEVRTATGDEENFLGAEGLSVKGIYIGSADLNGFSPHLNAAFEWRSGDLERNEIELFGGFEQSIGGLTLAFDVLAELQVGSQSDELKFPEPQTIERQFGGATLIRVIDFTNLPQSKYDHRVNAALGVKFSPKEDLALLGNLFVPLNDGGLRSSVVPTLGFEFSF